MCSIAGVFKTKISKEEFMLNANKSIYRGPDMTRYLGLDDVHLCFHRLAIMGLNEEGMQPFTLDSRVIMCNGEIYGFRKQKSELEKKYNFKSESDCEILLPLYNEYKEMMFNMLDAEFALIIYDKDTKDIIAARDPLGIRPLFYGTNSYNDEVGFASEAKCLVNIFENVLPFPPGYYFKNGIFTCYNNASDVKLFSSDDFDTVIKNIKTKLVNAVEKRLDSDSKIGYLLSGGLDSSLICSIASKISKEKIKTFAIGMEGDAIDLKYAKEVADFIGSNHEEVIITKDDVLNAIDKVIYYLESYDITTIRASIGMYLVCRYIRKNTDVKVLLTGEISDELFGYKYTDFAPNSYEFQMEAKKRVSEIYMYDVLRADRCISSNSMESRVPFGDIDFVSYVMSINPNMKMNTYNKGKYLLRKAFEDDSYLPNDILYREKAAFSDAVGHSMVDYIKEYAEKLYTSKEFEEKRLKYKNNMPFTKESLLYREIFEKYYPKKSGLIKDFWMPNKTWEGCNVSDPSARVLGNYGDSGK